MRSPVADRRLGPTFYTMITVAQERPRKLSIFGPHSGPRRWTGCRQPLVPSAGAASTSLLVCIFDLKYMVHAENLILQMRTDQ